MSEYFLKFFDKSKTRNDLKEKYKNLGLKFVSLKQVHGDKILVVDETNVDLFGSISPEADACISRLSHLVLSVHTADCQPILAHCGDCFGVCHAGWRGLVNGILGKFISAFESQGCDLSQMRIQMGASICNQHFEAHTDVAQQIASSISIHSQEKILLPHTDLNKSYVDLKEVARIQLEAAGIATSQIVISTECTHCETDKFFSFRRDKVKGQSNESIILKK